MQDVLTIAMNALQAHWAEWLTKAITWLVAGGGLWLVTQATKGFKQWEKASTIQKFAYGVGFTGTAADWFIRNYPSNFIHAQNPGWIPVMAAGLFTIATFIHHTPLKNFTKFLSTTVQPYFDAVKVMKTAKTAEVQPPASQDSFQ